MWRKLEIQKCGAKLETRCIISLSFYAHHLAVLATTCSIASTVSEEPKLAVKIFWPPLELTQAEHMHIYILEVTSDSSEVTPVHPFPQTILLPTCRVAASNLLPPSLTLLILLPLLISRRPWQTIQTRFMTKDLIRTSQQRGMVQGWRMTWGRKCTIPCRRITWQAS